MKIETKFNVGDTVYYLSVKIQEAVINSIELNVDNAEEISVTYCSCGGNYFDEKELFTTPKEAAEQWLKNNSIKETLK